MKNLVKKTSTRLLKVAAVGLFVFAMAFGASTTVTTTNDYSADIDLLALKSKTAQGERTTYEYYTGGGSRGCDSYGWDWC